LQQIFIERSSIPDQVFESREMHPDFFTHISEMLDGTLSDQVRNWAAKSSEDLLLALNLKSNCLHTGLDNEDAIQRLHTYGRNELESKDLDNVFYVLSSIILSSTSFFLLFVAVLAFLLHDFFNCIALVIIVGSYALVAIVCGWYLQKFTQGVTTKTMHLQAQCIRDRDWMQVEASELVPGDVVRIAMGDRVPADLRVLETDGLWIDESLLSCCASTMVSKRVEAEALDEMCGLAENIVYAHTSVIKGSGIAIVVETGMNTRIGRLSKLLSRAGGVAKIAKWMSTTPAWQAMKAWGGPTLVLCFLLDFFCFISAGTFEFQDPDALGGHGTQMWKFRNWLRSAEVALFLAVKLMPQVLTPWCIACLSLSRERTSRKGALVQNLSASESLGNCTTICTDMSEIFTVDVLAAVNLFGSIPKPHTFEFGKGIAPDGETTHGAVYLLNGSSRQICVNQDFSKSDSNESVFVKLALALASMNCQGSQSSDQAKFDKPISELAQQFGLDTGVLSTEFPTVLEVPFDSSNKLCISVHAVPQNSQVLASLHLPSATSHIAVTKGAPEFLLPHLSRSLAKSERGGFEVCCRDPDILQGLVEAQNSRFAAEALRVLLCGMLPLDQQEFLALKDSPIETMLTNLVFVSLLSFRDTIRHQMPLAVGRCLLAGVRVVMFTGEQLETAQTMARSMGIPGKAKLAATLRLSCGSYRPAVEIMDLCAHVNVWARAQPEDKITILKALQERERVCAVVRGSIDDMPMLYQAHVGVALASGQAVAKHVADIVLTESSFLGAVSAMEEAKLTSGNITKAFLFWLGISVGEFIGHVIAFAAHLPQASSSLGLLLGLIAIMLNIIPLCWEPAEADALPTSPKAQGQRPRLLLMWLGIPVVMLSTTYAGLVMHVGPVQNHDIIGLCEYGWHPVEASAGQDSGSVHRWQRDEAPYHCRCPALDIAEQWGRQQSYANNIKASGITGRAYAKSEGPFQNGTGSVLEPCRGRLGTPSAGGLCWKEAFLVQAPAVSSDGIENSQGKTRPLFLNILLHPELNCVRHGTHIATSMAWFATLLTQTLLFQSVRSMQPLHKVFWRNMKAVINLGTVVSMALLAMYLPVVNTALELGPVPMKSLALACVGPFSVLVLAEVLKMSLRQTTYVDEMSV
jgi:Ca2+-transporting ATPase